MDTYLSICFHLMIYVFALGAFIIIPTLTGLILALVLSSFIYASYFVYKYGLSRFIELPRFEKFTKNIFKFRQEFWIVFALSIIIMLPLGYSAGSAMIRDTTAKERKIVYEPVQIERFFLKSYHPPKHFYVTIEHLASGKIYENQYVSKHCNNISKDSLGTEFNIQTQVWYYEDAPLNKYVKFNNLYQVFCE